MRGFLEMLRRFGGFGVYGFAGLGFRLWSGFWFWVLGFWEWGFGCRLLGFGVFVFRFLGVGDSYIYNTYLSVEDTRTLLAQRRKLHDLFPRMSLTRFPECRREFHVSQGPIRFGLYGFARGLRL